MVFTFLFEISDFWRHLAIFFIIPKIKSNFHLVLVWKTTNNTNNFLSKLQVFWSATWIDRLILKGIWGKNSSVNVHWDKNLLHYINFDTSVTQFDIKICFEYRLTVTINFLFWKMKMHFRLICLFYIFWLVFLIRFDFYIF